MNRRLKVLAIWAILTAISITPIWAQTKSSNGISGIEVTYIANEGMLISAGEQQVLIDGLFRGNPYDYQGIPPELLEKLETAREPYHEIDLVLVTHLHLDHFHSESVGRHLEYNTGAELAAGQDVVDLLASDYSNFAEIEKRAHGVTRPWKECTRLTIGGFNLDILSMRHGGERNYGLDHLGFLFEIGGQKILHIGDVEMTAENFTPFDLPGENIDIAFIPDWFLTDAAGQKIVRELIAPGEIVAIHIAPAGIKKRKEEIQSQFPNAVVFEKPLDKKIFRE